MSGGRNIRRISWSEGLKSGLRTTWELGKVIFPVTLIVTVLQYTAVYDVLLSAIEPAMSWFGLPSGAAVPLLLGSLLNLYAAIGAIVAIELTVKQVFILAVMLSFSHMLPVEGAVCRRIGVSVTLVTFVRVSMALLAGMALNLAWAGGSATANYGMAASPGTEPSGWAETVAGALQSAGASVFQLALIVFPVMVFIQAMKDLNVLDWFAAKTRPLMRPLGLPARGAVTMASGLLFGLAFGAGVILEQARQERFTRRELTLMVLFLSACHAIVEDTLIFLPLGINVFYLLLARLALAVALTVLIATLWKAKP
jgi:hypothetical protein